MSNTLEDVKDLCRRMEDLCVTGDIPPFDRVRLATNEKGEDEVWFLWEDQKKVVVVELTAEPEDLTAALSRAAPGDPVLN